MGTVVCEKFANQHNIDNGPPTKSIPKRYKNTSFVGESLQSNLMQCVYLITERTQTRYFGAVLDGFTDLGKVINTNVYDCTYKVCDQL